MTPLYDENPALCRFMLLGVVEREPILDDDVDLFSLGCICAAAFAFCFSCSLSRYLEFLKYDGTKKSDILLSNMPGPNKPRYVSVML